MRVVSLDYIPLELFEIIIQNCIKNPKDLLSLRAVNRTLYIFCRSVKLTIPWSTTYITNLFITDYIFHCAQGTHPSLDVLHKIANLESSPMQSQLPSIDEMIYFARGIFNIRYLYNIAWIPLYNAPCVEKSKIYAIVEVKFPSFIADWKGKEFYDAFLESIKCSDSPFIHHLKFYIADAFIFEKQLYGTLGVHFPEKMEFFILPKLSGDPWPIVTKRKNQVSQMSFKFSNRS